MLNRRLIVAADDLGLTFSFNAGILEAATQGFLTSTCVRVNGPAFEDAVYNIIPQCPNLGVGLHLNLVEGKTTRKNISIRSPLYDADGSYRLRFGGLYLGRKNKASFRRSNSIIVIKSNEV